MKPNRMPKPTLLLWSLLLTGFSTLAQNAQDDFQTTSISIFKDGTAFFLKSGTVDIKDGVYRITDKLPPALFGTYWMNTPNGTLSSLRSYQDTVETVKNRTVWSMTDMLEANLGRRVLLHLPNSEVVDGTVQAVETDGIDPRRKQIITLRTNNSWRTVLLSEVRGIDFFDEPEQSYEHKEKSVKPVLEAAFTGTASKQDLDLMYLSRGLNWTPLYLIELTGEKQARLTLRAEVVNNIEDIEDTDVHFVVGVPNFSFASRLSPLIDFNQPEHALNMPAREMNAFSNSLQSQTIGYAVMEDEMIDGAAPDTGLDGQAEEDLYFYTLKNMSLKKGGRGHYPVFTTDIDVSHIYECNLPQNTVNKYAYREEFLFSPNPNKVFHSVKVNNTTKQPFTTGAAMVVKTSDETKPISQDRLNYTPIGGNSFVKLTEAPDVQIRQAEKAVSTIESDKKINRGRDTYFYDKITVTGQIKVKNYKSQKIDLNIRRSIYGQLQESSIPWLKAERINANGDINQLTDVCWETSVAGGAELTITYTYEVFVPH